MTMKMYRTIISFLLISCALLFATEIKPYLQSPAPNSIFICWQSDNDSTNTVIYGLTEVLGDTLQGTHEKIGGSVVWHTVKLTGLIPNTVYYYKCASGDSSISNIFKFKTLPLPGSSIGHVRFGVLGDNRTEPGDHRRVINAMREKMIEFYGDDIESNINVVINVGDIVTDGWKISEYKNEYFEPVQPLSGVVPFMVSIGNHENESDYFYQHMKYEEFGGAEGEKYYSFQTGRTFFIMINSNWQLRNDTQIAWLDSLLREAETNDTIDWVFAFCHHPGHSEIWPDGNTSYIQDRVIPTLNKYSKSEFLIYGHSHNYERGAVSNGDLRIMLNGGGGSSLDRWRMYDNQKDYTEIQKSFDHYCYSIFDIDIAGKSYTCRSYSLGHTDLPLDNVLIDSFTVDLNDTAFPDVPKLVANDTDIELPVTLDGGDYSGSGTLHRSHFQITDQSGYYSQPIIDIQRDYENVYLDTGAPNWSPIDLNAGVDISKLEITTDMIPEPGRFYWRVRHRRSNLRWSEWSEESTINITNTGYIPILAHNKALKFGGVDEYVEIADTLDKARLPVRDMTAELWVNLVDNTSWGSFIGAIQDNGDYEKGWFLGNKGNTFIFGLSTTGADDGDGLLTRISSKTFKLNQWYHLAATYDGETMKLFVNGRMFRSSTRQSGDILYDINSFFDIGAYHDDDEFYVMNGQLDEIRLWQAALPDSIIQQWMHQELNSNHPHFDQLISSWNMNDNVNGRILTDGHGENDGYLQRMNLSDVCISTSPLGQMSAFISDGTETMVGPATVNITVSITSAINVWHYLGAYYFGTNDGSFINYEEFPENVIGRFDVLWGLNEYGQDFIFGDDIVADIAIDYSGITGTQHPDSIVLLRRDNALTLWTDITEGASHNKEKRTFQITGRSDIHEEYTIAPGIPAVGINENHNQSPGRYYLNQNYPNPFNASSTIEFSVAKEEHVKLQIYNLNGQTIATLVDRQLGSGAHKIIWDATYFSSGVYFIKQEAGTFTKVIKALLIK